MVGASMTAMTVAAFNYYRGHGVHWSSANVALCNRTSLVIEIAINKWPTFIQQLMRLSIKLILVLQEQPKWCTHNHVETKWT